MWLMKAASQTVTPVRKYSKRGSLSQSVGCSLKQVYEQVYESEFKGNCILNSHVVRTLKKSNNKNHATGNLNMECNSASRFEYDTEMLSLGQRLSIPVSKELT